MQIGIGGTAGDTWDRVKVNAPGDPPGQPPNVYDEADAVYSAAHYRQTSGAPGDRPGAIFTYNHSSAYVQQVFSLAAGYYTQGLTAQGTGGLPTTASSGAVTKGSAFAVPRASADPAGPITLAQGQPTMVAATLFTDHTGAWGDNLTVSTDSYAELSAGLPRSQVTKQNASMLESTRASRTQRFREPGARGGVGDPERPPSPHSSIAAMLSVARRFAVGYMPYQVGRLPGWARAAINRTCTEAFARYLLSLPAQQPPLLSAHPTDAETYRVASVNLAAGADRVSVSYVSEQDRADTGAFLLTLTLRQGRWLVVGLET